MSEEPDDFKILGSIRSVEIIATGRGVRFAGFLKGLYGGSRWRKLKRGRSYRGRQWLDW